MITFLVVAENLKEKCLGIGPIEAGLRSAVFKLIPAFFNLQKRDFFNFCITLVFVIKRGVLVLFKKFLETS